ncbi:MAG: hypothetical protein M1833_006989 [Piccolia ochrophora]|nr:MAG: hypothetical protein M1833_006989 [Piccolia ochrophora]
MNADAMEGSITGDQAKVPLGTSPPPVISLQILSPSTEIPNPLSFDRLPTATTIAELKERIRDSTPTRPAIERQRLIHRGRLLGSGSDTLANGKDGMLQSLHLVLRPSGNASHPQAGPGNLADPVRGPSQVAAAHTLSGDGVTETPTTDQTTASTQSGQHAQGAAASSPFNDMPAQVHELIQAQLAAFHHHRIPPAASPDPPPGQARHPWQAPGPVMTQTPGGVLPPVPQTFEQHVAEHQRARAAAGLHGVGNNTAGNSGDLQPHNRDLTLDGYPREDTAGGSGPESGSLFTSEGVGPNGQRWQVTVNERNITIPFPVQNTTQNTSTATQDTTQHDTRGQASLGRGNNSPMLSLNSPTTQQDSPSEGSPRNGHGQMEQHRDSREALRQHLERIEADVRNESLTWETGFNQIRDFVEQNREHAGAIHGSLAHGDVRQIVNSPSPTAPAQEAAHTTHNPNSPVLTQRRTAMNATSSPAVFILSSPAGPWGLLVGPSGVYTTRSTQTPLPSTTVGRVPVRDPAPQVRHLQNLAQQLPARQSSIHSRTTTSEQSPEAPQVPTQQPQRPHPPPHPPVEPQRNPANDLGRILIPLGGHIWLLIRLLGFVFFFTSGAGWRRTVLLVLGALIIFIAQFPIFHGVYETLLAPLRQHLEALLPLDGNRARTRGPRLAGQQNAARSAGPQEPRPASGAGGPAPAAEQQQFRWVSDRFRAVERAMVMFLASLVPGVGERHIAAHDAAVAEAAEAARQTEREAHERATEALDAAEPAGEQRQEEHLGNAPAAVARSETASTASNAPVTGVAD